MRRKTVSALILSLTALWSCQTEENQENMPKVKNDPHSFSRPGQAVVSHLELDIETHFDEKRISGTASWNILNNNAREIIFDTDGLEIEEVTLDTGSEARWQLGAGNKIMGKPLEVKITPSTEKVHIRYKTSRNAKALQWLDPEQTFGGEMPFLFTQSQAILARTWIPCQDGPGIRYTYNARVKVPRGMMALMSAENPVERTEDGIYEFRMTQAVPAYLMALAAGDIDFESLSERTGVYAEPGMLDSAVYEFADTDKMMQAAEKLYGGYVWERYDILVLPPSFPFGGMENPRLTFATPTILAGDRSLVSLVAHELAHSWSGNLVTNATWNDFWLNEGFTVYFELRIMEELYGREYSEMLAMLNLRGLKKEVEEIAKKDPADTKLKLDLEGRDPDEGMTSIAYDKGYFFLRLIEETAGRERWDNFLRAYFNRHRFEVMDTEKFLEELRNGLITEKEEETIRPEEWIYEAGLPDNCPQPQSDRFEKVDSVISGFLENRPLPDSSMLSEWSTHEWLYFIENLPEDISLEEVRRLDKNFGFTSSGNSEILAAWFQPVIRTRYEKAYPRIEEFLVEVGRRKFLTPTYRALKESGQEDIAMGIYSKARPNYHAVSRQTMDELLGYGE